MPHPETQYGYQCAKKVKEAWYDQENSRTEFLSATMRILVISHPASGHARIRTLLSKVYGLRDLNHNLDEPPANGDDFQKFVENGKFTDNAILSHHYSSSKPLVDSLKNIPCHVIFCIRNRYNAFDGLYFNANNKVGILLLASASVLRDISPR